MRANVLKSLLADHGISPLKARGQHFLLDDAVIVKMIDAAGIVKGDAVVEIGPGPGILTEALVAAGAGVVAVELDPALADLVESRFDKEQVRVIRRDARHVSNAELLHALGDPASYKVVANIPYGITSDTIVKFLREAPLPTSMTLMVQREVADRIIASPPDMSALAVTVQCLSDAKKIANVPAGAFLPPPKVDSAVIHITMKAAASVPDPVVEEALRLAHAAFTERRKQLRNTLTRLYPENRLNTAISEAGSRLEERPERLTAAQWIALARALTR
jgi:16S rRNA (adenine1518-N6/adenine1519-N6)-dimethyltransferase